MFNKEWKAKAALLALGLLVPLTACSVDRTYLPALLADPMASYEAEGIELVDALEEAEGHDIIMDMPTHAEVWRKYRIVDQSQAGAILTEAAAYAESQGWRLTLPRTNRYGTGIGGSKTLAAGDGRLGLSVIADDPISDPDGPRALSIRLDYGFVRFDDTTTSTS